jgi:hypothetical protein
MKLRQRWPLLALPLLLVLSGCGGGPKLVRVTGRVLCDGKPVPSTQVYFQPDDGGRFSTGLTDDDGNFTLRYSRTEEGVVLGKHKVHLKYVVGNDEYNHTIEPKASKELKGVIERYDADKSDLHAEVTKSGQFIEIQLTP